jgi:hypothetical protein
MPGSDVNWPVPLTRLNPWFPSGQMGVPGADHLTGERLHSSGVIYYVDPNAAGVSDQRDGTDPTEPLATVAAALAKCLPYHGDVVAIMANNGYQYGNPADGRLTLVTEEVVVDVPGVRIVGVCPSGSLGVYWYPVTAAGAGVCITVNASDVLIEGIAFCGGLVGGTAISADWDGIATFGDSITVRHCYFDDNIDTGIALEFVYNAEIRDNYFEACPDYGVYVDPAGSGIAYCRIHDNWFHNCGAAMAVNGADYCRITGNWIFNANAQGAGAATDEGIDTTAGSQNLVANNYFSCLLPVPANGDWNDLNSGAATDAWVGNHCMDGLAVTIPT